MNSRLAAVTASAEDFFLLKTASARSRAYSSGQRERIAAYRRASAGRLMAASSLRAAPELGAAYLLHREALRLLCLAAIAQEGAGGTIETAELASLWQQAEPLLLRGRPRPAISGELGTWLADTDPLTLDRLNPADARRRLHELARHTRWLGQSIEARSALQIQLGRMLRINGVIAVVAVLAALALSGGSDGLTNLALDCDVTASGYLRGSKPAGALTNDVLEADVGSQTGGKKGGWFRIDLGRREQVTQIEIFNRGDDKAARRTPPLEVQGSMDGKKHFRVAQRKASFTQKAPWLVDLGKGRKMRYVRIRAKKAGPFALSEVRVFGE